MAGDNKKENKMPRFEVPLHEIEKAWDETDITSAEIIEEGWYKAEIKDFETRRKDENSSPYISWRFQIIGGDFDGMPVWDVTSLSSKSIWNNDHDEFFLRDKEGKLVIYYSY